MIPDDSGGGRTFPALGFDPAPGDVGEVDALVGDLKQAVTALGEGASLLKNLSSRSGSDWQGKAADAFREHADTDLPKSLQHAHDSFEKARAALAGWSLDLTEFQSQADTLERRAEQAKAALATAQGHLADVKANPYHATGPNPSPDVVARAKTMQVTAESNASSAVAAAQHTLDDIIASARTLQGRHHDSASTAAKALHDAPDHLAPHKPGFFASLGNWIGDHAGEIGDVLADISAVAGIAALVTPPPIDAIALGISVVTAVGAAGFHKAAGKGWGTVGLDLVGALPGIGVLGDAAKGARAAETVKDGLSLARGASSAGDVGFGLRYAASGVGDTARAVPTAVRDGLDEAKVFGSNLSRSVVNGLDKIPGVTVHDGLTLAANIDRGVAGAGGLLGVGDIGVKVHDAVRGSHGEVPGATGAGYGLGGYGAAGQGLDWAVRLNRLPLVQVP